MSDSARPLRSWIARPASTDRGVFLASLDGVLSCAAALIAKAVHEGSNIAIGPANSGHGCVGACFRRCVGVCARDARGSG